jgi:hypothetical protein
MTGAAPREFAKWPLYSGIAIVAIASALWALPSFFAPIGFVGIACLLLVIIVLLGAVIWGAALALFRRQWRLALSMAAFPLTVSLIFPATDAARAASNELRFLIHKSRYDAEVTKAKEEGKYYVTVDDWSIFFNAHSFVVWDAWDKPEEVVPGFKEYQNFGGHFYLVND